MDTNTGKQQGYKFAGLILAFAASQVLAQPQQDFSAVEVVAHPIGENLYYLVGSGGNIGVSVGEDGIFLIDDQYAPLTDKILAAIRTITDERVRFVFNTHHHGDHTGGNANMGQAGAIIVAHDNVRTNLTNGFNGGDLTQALTAEQRIALPVVTFADTVDFHLNGHDIHAFHVPPAHTNGDAFVVFENLNIIHTGDVFRTTSYPRADIPGGGSVLGILAAYQTLIDISDDATVFLPGHGMPSKRSDVQAQLAMFTTIRDRVQAGIDGGKTVDEIKATKPTAEFDAQWSNGVATAGDDLVTVFFNELSAQ
jgi:glyoxylase-like metal-dependent hydrolase (beta-lactamase superfamily II)